MSAPGSPDRARAVVGADEVFPVVDTVAEALRRRGYDVEVVVDPVWPDVGRRVAEQVVSGEAAVGVCFCWTGTGVSIAANKVPGARAALCADAETARGARRWNDANVLAMSLRLTTPTVAEEIVEAFLGSRPDPDESDNIARLGGPQAPRVG